jgi:hypothetical protein
VLHLRNERQNKGFQRPHKTFALPQLNHNGVLFRARLRLKSFNRML